MNNFIIIPLLYILIFLFCILAKENEDFLKITTILNFAASGDGSTVSGNGSNEQCVSVPIIDDHVLEQSEIFTILAVGDGPVNVIHREVTVIIQEDPSDCK